MKRVFMIFALCFGLLLAGFASSATLNAETTTGNNTGTKTTTGSWSDANSAYIINSNKKYAWFSQENQWTVVKTAQGTDTATYEITPKWQTYGTIEISIQFDDGMSDGAYVIDHYKNGKYIASYNGSAQSGILYFSNPDGFSTFVVRKPGATNRTGVPNTSDN